VTSFQCDANFQALEYYGEYNHRQPKWRQSLQLFIQRMFRVRNKASTATTSSSKASKQVKHDAGGDHHLKEFEEQFNAFQRDGNLEETSKAGDEVDSKDRYEAHQLAYDIIQDMWQRKSVEDLLFMLYVLLDSFSDYPIKSVQAVTNSANTNLKQVFFLFFYYRLLS
jgi:hypothetical protein